MRIAKPTFYDRFHCIADACDFTCCQEWKIAVDDETNKKWKNVKPPQGMKTRKKNLSLFTRFKDGQRVIDLNKEHKCPFLSEDKLCKLVCQYGEDMISETCHIFPREIHEFEDGKEYTLMPCCPVTIDFLKDGKFEVTECQTPEDNAECQTPLEMAGGNLSNLRKLRKAFMEIQEKQDFSLEEALLTNFYLMLDEFKGWEEGYDENLPEDEIMPYQMEHEPDELLTFSEEIRKTIRGLSFDAEGGFIECNELFLDLIDNYRKEGIYDSYLNEVAAYAEDLSEKGAGTFTYEEMKEAWSVYEDLMRNFLLQELYADLLIPGGDLEGALVKLQWISMEYVAIRHLCFLSFKLRGSLDYKAVRDYIVLVSRIMGYEEDDIYEYMENMFEDLVWDWGYMALIVGR